jgi:hypothetical protein
MAGAFSTEAKESLGFFFATVLLQADFLPRSLEFTTRFEVMPGAPEGIAILSNPLLKSLGLTPDVVKADFTATKFGSFEDSLEGTPRQRHVEEYHPDATFLARLAAICDEFPEVFRPIDAKEGLAKVSPFDFQLREGAKLPRVAARTVPAARLPAMLKTIETRLANGTWVECRTPEGSLV